jgi:alkylhydroperoxidase family enzyme
VLRIDVPDGRDPLLHLWTGTGNELTGPAAAFSDAVYRKSTLPLREFEAARITVARVNQCVICLNLRPEGGPDQAFYDAVLDGAEAGLTEREALAAEFARRFATDHLGMDDASGRACTPRSATASSSSWGCAPAPGWRSAG